MIDAHIDEALRSTNRIGKLRDLAQRLLDEGREPEEIYRQFETARRFLRDENREHDEEAVMDVMDFLVGWCSPHMKFSGKSV